MYGNEGLNLSAIRVDREMCGIMFFDVAMSEFLVFMNDVIIPCNAHLLACILTDSFIQVMIESQAPKSFISQSKIRRTGFFLTKLWGVTFAGSQSVYIQRQALKLKTLQGYKIKYWPLCIIFIYQEHKTACLEF